MLSGTQTTYPCLEHEVLNIPVSDLMDADGNLNIYPEVASTGYFDIDFHGGKLSVRARRCVGLIPISDTVAIHVRPRAKIANLLTMVWRAGGTLGGLPGFIRGYHDHPNEVSDPESLYLSTFLSAVRGLKTTGILKRYLAETSETTRRGRLLFVPTIARLRSKGIRRRQVFEFHELTVDNPENRIIKHTAERLLVRLSQDSVLAASDEAAGLRELLAKMDQVDCASVNSSYVARVATRVIRTLPRNYRFYESALWLSYLIATKSGVKMERIGRANFESVIIDTSDVFERYVRKLLEEAAVSHLGGCRVFNGNVRQVHVFVATDQFLAQPDYYFRSTSGNRAALAVADAKYKPKLDAEDRYALISYCEFLNVKRAAFICPQFNAEPLTIHQGTTRGGTEVHVVRIALDAVDLQAEEALFKSRIAKALGFDHT